MQWKTEQENHTGRHPLTSFEVNGCIFYSRFFHGNRREIASIRYNDSLRVGCCCDAIWCMNADRRIAQETCTVEVTPRHHPSYMQSLDRVGVHNISQDIFLNTGSAPLMQRIEIFYILTSCLCVEDFRNVPGSCMPLSIGTARFSVLFNCKYYLLTI